MQKFNRVESSSNISVVVLKLFNMLCIVISGTNKGRPATILTTDSSSSKESIEATDSEGRWGWRTGLRWMVFGQ